MNGKIEEHFTEAETQAERDRVRGAGELAAKKLAARAAANLPVTRGDLVYVAQVCVANAMDFTLAHCAKRYAPLSEAGSLERALTPIWRGFWTPGSSLAANSLVGYKHGLWVSERPTAREPGTPDSGWKLIARRPR